MKRWEWCLRIIDGVATCTHSQSLGCMVRVNEETRENTYPPGVIVRETF